MAVWLAVAVALGIAACLGSAAIARFTRRPYGVVLGLLLGAHAAINWRFEYVLNEFVRDPRVWGGMAAALVAGVVVGLAADRLLRRAERAFKPWVLGIALVAAGIAFVRARPPDGDAGPLPSFLVVTMDTVRPDRLSPYGRDIATPALRRLADEGVTFDQAVAAAPITEPSHLSMFTGLAPVATGVVSNGTVLGDRPALAWHALRRAGYLTAGFVAGFPLHSKYGWAQGFDVYDDDFGALAGVQSLSITKAWNQVAVKEHALRERAADRVLARAVPWLRAHRDEQFFLWVHLYDAHGPYVSPYNAELGEPPTSGSPANTPVYWPEAHRRISSAAWLSQAYDMELRYVDDAVGQLVEALGPALDRTVVVATADHGESLGEHDYWFDHGDDLYDPSLRVPLIVRYPPVAKAGLRVGCQVGGVDLAPTLLDLAGVPDATEREGVSRVPELRGEACRERPVFASTTAGRFVARPPVDHALRGNGAKLVRKESGAVELYDLVADPRELVNLAPSPLSEKMGALLEQRARGAQVTGPETDDATMQMMRELGYVD
ncbi:MAG: sulfatase [Myxococcota bacterium]